MTSTRGYGHRMCPATGVRQRALCSCKWPRVTVERAFTAMVKVITGTDPGWAAYIGAVDGLRVD